MPVAAVSGLLTQILTRFSPDREQRFADDLAQLRAGGVIVRPHPAGECDCYEEQRVYSRERGFNLGFGESPNADGTRLVTVFGVLR